MIRKHNIVLAIDGYSSCGKSTLALALSKKLHFIYVDSGAMYRAITLYFIRNQVDLADQTHIAELLDHDIHITFEKHDSHMTVLLNGEDVSDEIREMPVSDKVSQVSAIHEVRQEMVRLQQKLGKTKNIVMDGRDIGTTVFPEADLKIFMIADPEIRAQRRYLELLSKGKAGTLEEVKINLQQRDQQDTSRSESPLRQAEDAIVLDNTFLSQEEQLEFVLQLMQERQLIPGPRPVV